MTVEREKWYGEVTYESVKSELKDENSCIYAVIAVKA